MKSITQVVESLIKPYIDSHDRAAEAIIAPVETDATSASDDYAVGKQLILNNVLYDVIAPITTGGALVVNTNIKAADKVSSDIEALTNNVDDIYVKMGQNGAKNLLDATARIRTGSAVSQLSYDGQTIIVNGNLGNANTRLYPIVDDSSYVLPAGTYILSGQCSDNNLSFTLRKNGTVITSANPLTTPFEFSANGSDYFTVLIHTAAATYTNATAKAMICPKSWYDIDATYQPYAKTNKELTAENQTLTNDTYNVNDTAITEVASDDLLPIYDTSATGKKKIAISSFIGGLVSNPNLLDNPWFTVNQRGQASYNTYGSIGYDRWRFYYSSGGGGSVSKSGSVVALQSTGSYVDIVQKLEDTSDLIGKTLTFSMLMSDGTIKSGSALFDGENVTFYNEQGTLSLDYSKPSLSFRIVVFGSRTVSFKAVKIERGSVSTLAQDTAPNYATELLKCQRYFVRYISPDFFEGYTYDATTARFGLVLPVPMRTNPSFSVDDITHLQVIGNGSGQALTTSQTISNSGFGTNKKVMEISGLATALSANIPVFVKLNSGYIDLSADL